MHCQIQKTRGKSLFSIQYARKGMDQNVLCTEEKSYLIKFLNPQNEATMQAAKLAGFKHVELLQEPVAAATAYGLSSKNKDGFWLVFDFGGGTFDAAILKSDEGILTVKDTDGDNWLGGKNLDDA